MILVYVWPFGPLLEARRISLRLRWFYAAVPQSGRRNLVLDVGEIPHMGGCQTYGLFVVPYYNTAPSI